MIRVLLAVLLATAIVGVSLSAVQTADRTRAATRTHAAASTLADALDRVATDEDPVPAGEPGANRVLTVRLPAGSRLHVGTGGDRRGGGTLRWNAGGRAGRLHLSVALAVPAGEPVELRGGTHRLRVGYVACPDGSRVTVRRFKTDAGTTPTRVPERGAHGVCL